MARDDPFGPLPDGALYCDLTQSWSARGLLGARAGPRPGRAGSSGPSTSGMSPVSGTWRRRAASWGSPLATAIALVEMQLARAAVVVEPVGDVRVLLDLDERAAAADRVDGVRRDVEEVARRDRVPVEHVLDRAVERGGAHRFGVDRALNPTPSVAPGSASITSQHSSLPCRPRPAASVCVSDGWTWTDSFSLVNRYLTSSCGRSAGGSNQISPMRLPGGVANGAGSRSLPQGFSTVLVSSSMSV